MFNIGAGEMILIALVLLIAVGPEQLPGVIRRTGRVVGQLKTMSDNLRRDFNSSLDEIERAADVKSWAGPELEATVETVKEATVEPFKTDFGVDGSTKVTDLWSNPPSADTEPDTTDPDSEVDDSTTADDIAAPEASADEGEDETASADDTAGDRDDDGGSAADGSSDHPDAADEVA